MGCGVNPDQWWAKGSGASMELGRCLEPLAPLRPKINVVNGLFNKHAHGRRHPSRPDRQHPLRGRVAEGGRAEGRHQRRPDAGQAPGRGDRPAEHGPRAASSRSPATTRRTSRWRTARTSPGRARPRRCRWRSTRRWRSTPCSTTAAASGTRASSTASARRPPACSRKVGAGDRAKLDEYLTSVREVERRVVPMRSDKEAGDARAADRNRPRPDDAPARQRPARGHPRAHAADVRPHRPGVPDRQDPHRHAAALPRHLGPVLPVPRRPRGAPRGLARRQVRGLRAGDAVTTWASSPTSPPASTPCPRARARCSTTPACCSPTACGRAPGTTRARSRSSWPAASGGRSRPAACSTTATRATTAASSAACTSGSWTGWACKLDRFGDADGRLAGF